MSCKVTIYHPITGLEVESKLWNQINSEVLNENYADKLYAQTRSEQFLAWFGNQYNHGESISQVVNSETLEPLVVYHSSPYDFNTFDINKSNELGFHFGTLKAALERFSPGKIVSFEDDISGEIIDIPLEDRRKDLKSDGFLVKPYFLNIRNMVEGVDNIDFDSSKLKDQEDGDLLKYLDEATYSNDFKRLVLAFYQKGKITYDDVNQILTTENSVLSSGIHGPQALRKALGNPDGYWYKNSKEDEGSISYVVFDPNNIKSLYNEGKYSQDENTLYSLGDNQNNQDYKFNKPLFFGKNQNSVNVSDYLNLLKKYNNLIGKQIQIKYDNDKFNLYTREGVEGTMPNNKEIEKYWDYETIGLNEISDISWRIPENWKLFKTDISANEIDDILSISELVVKDENTFYNIKSETAIDFTLKVINALQKTPRKTYPSNNTQGFYNDLIKQGAPKDQIQLLKDYILKNNIQEINVQDLITGLASEISYTIEINTTISKSSLNTEDNESLAEEMMETGQKRGFENRKKDTPTQHYADLTVPGGTNYTENEIATPAIVPSIKGHAQFSTDNGIGWFRGDDRMLNRDERTVPNSWTSVNNPNNVVEKGTSTKTRRILEVQSDLFQKGRDKENLHKFYENKFKIEQYEGKFRILNSEDKYKWEYLPEKFDSKEEAKEFALNLRGNNSIEKNQFLQLLNKDNNWVTFFVKSIIQDSAKKGYEKVLFPSGNTAAKVERHNTLETLKEITQDRIKELKNNLELTKDDEWIKGIIEYEYENNEYDPETGPVRSSVEHIRKTLVNRYTYELKEKERELDDIINGRTKLGVIHSFYEKDITNILKKQGYNPTRITDEYGNTWNEVEITSKAYDTILFNLKKQGYYKSIPENLLGVMSRNSILSRVTKNLEDRWYFVRGELDQNNNINDNIARYNQFMSMNNINQDMFVFNNTEGDKAPYLTINPKFKEEDTIVENNEKIHKEKYEAIIQFFQDKFGIKKEQIVYTNKEEFKKQFPEAYQENMQSVYSNGKFYFFTRNLTSDITVEELLHPFIYTVKELNPQLFDNLLKEAKLHYPKLNTKIQTLYAGKSKSVRDQELVTQALSRVFNNVYENEEPQSFIDTIKDFVKWIREIMSDIFNHFKTGKYINIPIEKLDPQTSLYEISKIINAVDTRFDVIFPNKALYSLEENTSDFNRTVEKILTDEKVATKINEIFVKLPAAIKNIKNRLNNTINEIEKKNLQGIVKNMEELENEDSENLIAFQLKGIIASVQLSNELLKNLNAMASSNNDDNIKLSYYMSVYKTAKAMDGFKDLMIELKDELSSNLVLSNTKDVNTFIGMLGKAISSEDEIAHKIQKLVKAPLLNKLVESSEYAYQPKMEELKNKIADLENQINKTASQKEKDNLFNKISPLRRELKLFQEKAPTKENLQKIFDGVFKDANVLSHIFEAKIANGNPLVATLQNIINDIYDSAGRDMLDYKNEAQSQIDKYSKATGIGLRDQERRYEQIRDIVKLPTNVLLDDNKNPVLDSDGKYQFEYVNQDTLLSNIDNTYLTQYLELEMVKDFLLEKHRENTYNNTPNEEDYNKYREALTNFQDFIKENSEREFSDKIYEFKAIMDEIIGGKTLREITSNYYNELDEQQVNLEAAADTAARMQILERIKDINIELKRLRTEYYEDGSKKEGDDLKIAQLLTQYNKLRNEYYSSTLSESAQKRYEFDKQELEKKKQQYIDDNNESTYRNNLKRIEQEIISPDYFTALSGITGEINELSNLLSEAAANQIPQYIDKNIFKQQKKDVYNEIRELSKPYRDEDGVIDGSAMLKRHPEVALKIKDLQQYIEDLRFETSNIGKLSIAESNELFSLREKKEKSQEEEARFLELATKQKAFINFKKQNEDLLKQLNNLYQQLNDLTTTHTTDYFDKEKQKQLDLLKINPKIIDSSKEFVKTNTLINIRGIRYEKGGEGRDSDIWYREQVIGKKSEFIPLDRQGDSGYNEILDIVTGYLASLSLEDTEWWKNNHYTVNYFDEKNKTWSKKDRPIYIWEHLTPNNPNFIETKPAKQYYKYEVKDEFLNKNFKTTYREIPIPKKGKFENSRYNDIVKNKPVFEFLQYFTQEYLADQEIYSIRGKAVKMGYVLPAVAKTSGENAVNITNKLLSFDGTITEMFKENVQATDNDTSYLVGGGQTNNKIVPIRFVGKIDTKAQTKNIVASLLLFKYHASLYKALNESLPVFEASQLLASNVDVLKAKNYADKLSFSKKIFNMFSSKRRKEEELETKDVEKSVLSKSVDDVLNIFVYGQRMKPEILNLGPLGTVDLAKVSSGILGLAAKSIFIGNIFSAINNSLSTRLQVIINADVKSNLYSLQNMRNAQAKAPKYTKDMLSDWTKLGNKSLIGQVLDHFSFLAENPSREITSKAEFTMLKNKMEFLTSPKQMSEFEVLFLQFLTVADATPVMINGKLSKLSNIEDVFEIKDGKFKVKDGVEFSKEQEKIFRGKYQSVARKVAGAYRTTEISSLETNWAGKSGMFLRRYFVGMATNRFQGSRFSFQEGDVYTGYQREVFKNIVNLFTEYKGNLPKYYNQLSDKEKAAHLKMLTEYGLLIVFMGLFNLMGGDEPKKELKKNSYAYNLSLVALLRAKTELQQFTFAGIDDLTRIGKNPFMVFQTVGNITKVIWLVKPTIFGEKSAYYQQNTGLHKEGDSKLVANFLKVIGYTGATWHPEEYIVNFRNAQNR